MAPLSLLVGGCAIAERDWEPMSDKQVRTCAWLKVARETERRQVPGTDTYVEVGREMVLVDGMLLERAWRENGCG